MGWLTKSFKNGILWEMEGFPLELFDRKLEIIPENPCVSYVDPTNEEAGVVLIVDTVETDGIIYSVTSIEKRAFYQDKGE